jgi:hypothetical protein
VASFPQVSPPKPRIHLSSPTYLLHASPITFFTSFLQYYMHQFRY